MRALGLAALMVAVGLCSAIPTFAADTAQNQPGITVPANEKMDLGEVQKNLKPFVGAFGVKAPDTTTSTDSPTTVSAPEDHKTLGDVGDRALDMLQAVTAKVADTLSKVAPKVWEIMVRQQYAKAYSGLVVPTICLIMGAIFCFVFGRMWKKAEGPWGNGEGDLTQVGVENVWRLVIARGLPSAAMVISGIFLGIAIQNAILYLVNPEYYAIQDLIQSIMNGGVQPTS